MNDTIWAGACSLWRRKATLVGLAALSWAATTFASHWNVSILGLSPDTIAPLIAGAELFILLALSIFAIGAARTGKQIAERERAAQNESSKDALTGLLNRRSLYEALGRKGTANPGDCVLYIDLDGFKAVNDTLGHAAGDRLLVDLSAAMQAVVAHRGTLARLGGDEFALLLQDSNIESATAFGMELLVAIRSHTALRSHTIRVDASIGIAASPMHGSGPDLVRRADIALYEAKRQGRGRIVLFDVEMEKTINYRSYMLRDMRAALMTREMFLVYQPIYAEDGATIHGVEALLRWKHSFRGMIPPSEFIPVAEETGFITTLGAWALEQACRDSARWSTVFIAVNLSPVQLRSPTIVSDVRGVLQRTGLDPHRLVLEITEGVMIDAAGDAGPKIAELRALGVRIALDDFGTGYSSLAYLKQFPFDKLKIDRTFIADSAESIDDLTLLGSIINLGRALGMTVVAEGVETPIQHEALRALGCNEMQGFLFSHPAPAAEIARLLNATTSMVRLAS